MGGLLRSCHGPLYRSVSESVTSFMCDLQEDLRQMISKTTEFEPTQRLDHQETGARKVPKMAMLPHTRRPVRPSPSSSSTEVSPGDGVPLPSITMQF